MRLAARVGLDVAAVQFAQSAGKDVLLVKRFDRAEAKNGSTRRAAVSALTVFGLDEMQARWATYGELADLARAPFLSPKDTLHELFARMAFNVLGGNTDDHARAHLASWDGEWLAQPPAYDICPQTRSGREADQGMSIDRDDQRCQRAGDGR